MAKRYVQLGETLVVEAKDVSLWPEGKVISQAKAKEVRRIAARESLLALLKPGDTVYTIRRSVSRSGMRTDLSTIVWTSTGPVDVTTSVAYLCGWPVAGSILAVTGCGMDMGFYVVENLSYYLWPIGFGCLGGDDSWSTRNCPSNDHFNGDRLYLRHSVTDVEGNPEDREPTLEESAEGCVRHWHKSGSYALRHAWL